MSLIPYRENVTLKTYESCGSCAGTGFIIRKPLQVGGEVECPVCDGTGEKFDEYIYLPTGLFYSHEIVECIDATEHNALTDAQKDGVLLLLSCGLVDLNEGKAGRVRLLNWFGAESTTVENLTALLS